jgi:hypothetical protein
VTLAMINGGLGMQLAQVSRKGEIAYGVFAGLIWVVWMAVATASETKKSPEPVSEPAVGN